MRRPTRSEFLRSGCRRWVRRNGEHHRIGGPAVEQDDGDKMWIDRGSIKYGQFDNGVFKWYEGQYEAQSHWARSINHSIRFPGYEP